MANSHENNKKKHQKVDNSLTNIAKKSALAADLSLSKKLAVCAQQGAFRPIMKFLELSGHGVPWIAYCLYTVFSTVDINVLQVTMNLLVALIFDLAVVGTLKLWAKRSRPSYNNKEDMFCTVSVDNYSFPSGHATRASMATYYLLEHLKMGFPVRILLRIWCILIGFSRVILGRHHVSDVVAGFFIGYFQFIFVENYLFLSKEKCFEIVSYVTFQSNIQ